MDAEFSLNLVTSKLPNEKLSLVASVRILVKSIPSLLTVDILSESNNIPDPTLLPWKNTWLLNGWVCGLKNLGVNTSSKS